MTTLASPIEQAVALHGASVLDALTDAELEAMWYDWQMWARPNQLPPDGDWLTWVIMTGRGWGKTRTGAEWVRDRVNEGARRIALVGRTPADARDVMVEGESGLLSVFPREQAPSYEPSKRRITFHTGAVATLYSSENPDQLRGPQHDTAWCDELGSFKTSESWTNLQLGLRLGEPRQIVTTTPRPTHVIREVIKDEKTVLTRGSTYENKSNLAGNFLDQVKRLYEGTRLGQQEIHGELLEDTPGALWARKDIRYVGDEGCPKIVPELTRIYVAVDPACRMANHLPRRASSRQALSATAPSTFLADSSVRGSVDERAVESSRNTTPSKPTS